MSSSSSKVKKTKDVADRPTKADLKRKKRAKVASADEDGSASESESYGGGGGGGRGGSKHLTQCHAILSKPKLVLQDFVKLTDEFKGLDSAFPRPLHFACPSEESASELHEFAGVCLTQMRDAVVDLVKIVHDTKIKLPQGAANDPMDADETMEDIHKHYREYSRVVRGLVKNLRDEEHKHGMSTPTLFIHELEDKMAERLMWPWLPEGDPLDVYGTLYELPEEIQDDFNDWQTILVNMFLRQVPKPHKAKEDRLYDDAEYHKFKKKDWTREKFKFVERLHGPRGRPTEACILAQRERIANEAYDIISTYGNELNAEQIDWTDGQRLEMNVSKFEAFQRMQGGYGHSMAYQSEVIGYELLPAYAFARSNMKSDLAIYKDSHSGKDGAWRRGVSSSVQDMLYNDLFPSNKLFKSLEGKKAKHSNKEAVECWFIQHNMQYSFPQIEYHIKEHTSHLTKALSVEELRSSVYYRQVLHISKLRVSRLKASAVQQLGLYFEDPNEKFLPLHPKHFSTSVDKGAKKAVPPTKTEYMAYKIVEKCMETSKVNKQIDRDWDDIDELSVGVALYESLRSTLPKEVLPGNASGYSIVVAKNEMLPYYVVKQSRQPGEDIMMAAFSTQEVAQDFIDLFRDQAEATLGASPITVKKGTKQLDALVVSMNRDAIKFEVPPRISTASSSSDMFPMIGSSPFTLNAAKAHARLKKNEAKEVHDRELQAYKSASGCC